MKGTIDYYNNNADWYYWTTVALDVDALRHRHGLRKRKRYNGFQRHGAQSDRP